MAKDRYILPYEKRVHSQNGEDGIIEHLLFAINKPNKRCVEMGWGSDWKKHHMVLLSVNCTQNLVQNHAYRCVAYDMKRQHRIPKNVTFYLGAVVPKKVKEYLEHFPMDVDFFSLDIDSFDYEIMEGLINNGFKPKVICAETNRWFGYSYEFSMPYVFAGKYDKRQFHGVSYKKYRTYLESKGYKFFTLNSNGLNIFFYDPTQLDESKLSDVRLEYHPNLYDDNPKVLTPERFIEISKQHEFWNGKITHDMFK